MKPPLVLPTYLCGECGIEMLLDSSSTSQARAAEKSVTASCYTPRCAQKGVKMTVPLAAAQVAPAESGAPGALLSPQPVKES